MGIVGGAAARAQYQNSTRRPPMIISVNSKLQFYNVTSEPNNSCTQLIYVIMFIIYTSIAVSLKHCYLYKLFYSMLNCFYIYQHPSQTIDKTLVNIYAIFAIVSKERYSLSLIICTLNY